MRVAIGKFASQLTDEDSMAVLCILSHGEEGKVYGCDGELVSVNDICMAMDDMRCPQMRGKPKLIVIQACQGSKSII